MSDSLQPHGLQPTRLLCPWDSPGKNTGVGCHSLLQGIFSTQGQNLDLQHRRVFFFLTYRATREAHIKVKGWYYYFCDHPFVCLSRVLEDLRLPVLWRGFSASATMVIVLTKPLREVATPGGPLGHLASPSFPATALLDLCPFSHHS